MVSIEQEDDLVRLVLAEELDGVAKRVQDENRWERLGFGYNTGHVQSNQKRE